MNSIVIFLVPYFIWILLNLSGSDFIKRPYYGISEILLGGNYFYWLSYRPILLAIADYHKFTTLKYNTKYDKNKRVVINWW